jgi:hypothetical protein
MTTETLRLRVRCAGIVEGSPPQFAFTKLLTQPGGKQKLHSQYVPVPDAELAKRLRVEVHPGDEVEIVLETDWSKPGVPQVLLDVCLPSLALPISEVNDAPV